MAAIFVMLFAAACTDTAREGASESVTVEGVITEANKPDPGKSDEQITAGSPGTLGNAKPAGPAPAWGKSIATEMQLVMEELDRLQTGPPLHQLSPFQARKAPAPADAVASLMQKQSIQTQSAKVDTTGTTIPLEKGRLHARVYTPRNAGASNPGIVYFHGGGWVIGGIHTYDATARALAEQTGAIVVSVAYRKAPEYKFPTAHTDAFAAYKWVINNAQSLKINPAKVAVAGESAGANLAANVSIMARDNKVKPPVHQLLVYPVTSYSQDTPSYQQYAEAKPLGKATMNWFFDKYLRSPKDGEDPRISLVNVLNLTGLPPTTVINAQIDPLASEGTLYAEKLKAAGVSVNAKVYDGVTHEFFGMAAVLPQAKEAQAMAVADLRRSFGLQ